MAAGHSVDLGAGAIAYMNSVTSNRMLNNANAADLSGRRITAGNTLNNLGDVNRYYAAQNLPQVQVYDGGYQTTPTVGATVGPFVKFIPDGKVVVVGKRTSGARVGEYFKTRNASNGLRPGSYAYTIDRANGVNGEKRTPANIERHRGHNGGPIYFPSAVVDHERLTQRPARFPSPEILKTQRDTPMPREIDPRPATVQHPQPQQPAQQPARRDRPAGKNLRVLHQVDNWPKGHVIAPDELPRRERQAPARHRRGGRDGRPRDRPARRLGPAARRGGDAPAFPRRRAAAERAGAGGPGRMPLRRIRRG
jgi:hypothetical protein